MNMADQWKQILAHLSKLREAADGAPRHKSRRHSKHTASPVIRAYANAAQHRWQHKG
jgi:hypothetical protein